MRTQLIITAPLLGALLSITTQVHAYSFEIDLFRVFTNSTLFFQDDFGDGNPPPDSPTSVNNNGYGVVGTVGPEANGKLTLDSSGAVARTGPTGNSILVQGATLLTNRDNNNTTAGLKSSFSNLHIQGLFDLITPGINEAYGIQFSDRTSDNDSNDILELMVTHDGVNTVANFRRLDYMNATITELASLILDTSYDQIMLQVTAGEINDGTGNFVPGVLASLQYFDNGIQQDNSIVGSSIDPSDYLFHGEEYTRARFFARQRLASTVPEPATLTLMGLGLAGLGFTRRRQA